MAWTTPATYTNVLITATDMNLVRDNLREVWHEVAYTEVSADVSITSTSSASPNDIVSSGAITYLAVPHLIEFFAPQVIVGAATSAQLMLWDASTDLGIIGSLGGAAYNQAPPVFAARRLTPSAASHTYRIRGYVSAGTTTINAGAGGTDTVLPGYIRIWARGA